MKIAVGGFHIESCTFSPLLSREEDFRVLRGESLLKSYLFLRDTEGVELVPLLHARAVPGGPVERGFYERFKEEFLAGLRKSAPLDGLFLPMHGAVSVEGLEDAEGDLLAAAREVTGPDCLFAASYDLHGNLSPRVIGSLNLLSAYRTAPHIDAPQTLARVFGFLLRSLRENLRPSLAYIPVPVLLPGEQTSTEWEPGESLYAGIPDVIEGDAVMDASILIGYVWADEPRSSGSVVAFGLDAEKTRRAAAELAQRFWDARDLFQFGAPAASVDDCLRLAATSEERPVVISDSGDNPTAGGAGDTTSVLERMLALGTRDAVLASITDPAAVRLCQAAGEGASLELTVGGKLDPVHSRPLTIQARVKTLRVVPWSLSARGEPPADNAVAVVETGGVQVILTQRRTPFHRIADFTALDIDPHRCQVVVVKIGYLEPELKQLAARALLALSPGAVDQDITALPFQKIARPIFPFDRNMAWSPE